MRVEPCQAESRCSDPGEGADGAVAVAAEHQRRFAVVCGPSHPSRELTIQFEGGRDFDREHVGRQFHDLVTDLVSGLSEPCLELWEQG